MKTKQLHLCIIDAQNDFCASGHEKQGRRGSLFVENADHESKLLASLIDRLGNAIQKIHATLDSHQYNDCAHHVAWRTADNQIPDPFTIVTHQDILASKYSPAAKTAIWGGIEIPAVNWALQYTKALEENGRMPLCLWPVHCQIGSWGQNLVEPIANATNRWCALTNKTIDFYHKGQCQWTEHYSAIRADVVDPALPETNFNLTFLNQLKTADQIAWAGWAGSHCLRFTALDAINYFGPGANEIARKSVFFEDASAAVPDIPGAALKFSDLRRQFLEEVSARGAMVTTTANFNP